MSAVLAFLKREPVLAAAGLAALLSCCLVPPDAAYLRYFDLRTLALLYCLMVVVSGLRKAGLFDRLAHALCVRAGSVRVLGVLLVLLTFVSSMLITNDVALLTFVPFSVAVLGLAGRRKDLVRTAVLQTAAANLGSMLTPVGNPQNLYLYSFYGFSLPEFLRVTLPPWALSLPILLLLCLSLPGGNMTAYRGDAPALEKKGLLLHLLLFALCLCTVLRLLPWWVMLGAVVLVLLVLDRQLLLSGADVSLLLTFAAFFVFSGNLGRLEAVSRLLRRLLAGREYWTALLASQVISNVPAALLLSGFTENARGLLLGVDVGGLGTPIASLASLIALKLYSRSEGARPGRFLLEFTLLNLLLLLLLSGLVLLLGT